MGWDDVMSMTDDEIGHALMVAHANGVAEERERWTKAIAEERADSYSIGTTGYDIRAGLRNVLIRMGIAQ